ncbi:MAG: hypothetical protein ACT4NL_00880 [Pseudomarimonas sp.]
MPTTACRLLLLSLTVLLSSACQRGDAGLASTAAPIVAAPVSAAPSKPMPRACDLVSADQARAVLAQDAGLMSDDPENCLWASMQSPGQITMLMLQVSQADDSAQAQMLFEALIGMAGSDSLIGVAAGGEAKSAGGEWLAELGDTAWMSATSAELIGARQIHVRQGARLLSLNVTGMAKGDANAQLELAQRMQALARTAVATL